MEPQDILGLVELSWPFDSSNYPVIEHMNTDQRRTFALTHILKHIRRSYSRLDSCQRRSTSLDEIQRSLKNLIRESIRYAQISETERLEHKFRGCLGFWLPTPMIEVLPVFHTISGGTPFRIHIDTLGYSFDRELDKTEQLDHRVLTNLPEIGKNAFSFLIDTIGIACIFGYSREEFETWLTNKTK